MAEGDQPDDSQKTEDPTPKKLEEARKKGQVAMSREVNNWVMLLAATILLMASSNAVLGQMTQFLKAFIEHAGDIPDTPGAIRGILSESFRKILSLLGLPLLGLMAAAVLAPFVQVGLLFAPEVIKPDFSKISPAKGFSRLFSMRSLMEFAKGLMKLGLLTVVGVVILTPYFGQMEHMVGLPMPALLDEIRTLVLQLMTGVLTVLLVVAAIDLVYQRSEHYKKMRMTKQELKDEYKQTEGDPQIKSRLRQLRAERARQRMMQAVPGADVVITNPTHYSVALKYDSEEMEAPKVVAKGVDELALRIRELAKEHNIVLYENKPLARVLFETVEVDETIPPEHYKAVAEVISYVFKLKGRLKPT